MEFGPGKVLVPEQVVHNQFLKCQKTYFGAWSDGAAVEECVRSTSLDVFVGRRAFAARKLIFSQRQNSTDFACYCNTNYEAISANTSLNYCVINACLEKSFRADNNVFRIALGTPRLNEWRSKYPRPNPRVYLDSGSRDGCARLPAFPTATKNPSAGDGVLGLSRSVTYAIRSHFGGIAHRRSAVSTVGFCTPADQGQKVDGRPSKAQPKAVWNTPKNPW